MSGHSKWSTIKHKKAQKDARRGKLFTKLIKEITVAARMGGGDINSNPRLRTAVITARQNSMPTDNIDRAIKKGTGEAGGATFDSIVYEGYLAGGVALLVDCLTDNRTRTVAEVRNVLDRFGGNLASSGAVMWGFEHRALFRVPVASIEEDALIEAALAAGADDQRRAGDEFELLAAPQKFAEVRDALARDGIAVKSAEITWLPKSAVEVRDPEVGRQVLGALEALEDLDDVQATITNFEMSEELVRSMGG
jgi:YebC/PmpR family DNA-binding regulatory protein